MDSQKNKKGIERKKYPEPWIWRVWFSLQNEKIEALITNWLDVGGGPQILRVKQRKLHQHYCLFKRQKEY